ncbi:MAG: PAS domain S-box protein, partial [Candidatus Hermodarchaeota archaeon]|nr:PAS domain S-box protein [Candidatus Hermodarchaeota archaeon]
NRGCEELTSYQRKEVLGRSMFSNFVPSKQRTAIRKAFNMLHQNKESTHLMFDWTTKQGKQRTIEWNIAPSLDAKGIVKEIYAIGVDVTEQTEVEIALRESEKKFRTIFDNATDAILIVNTERQIIEANNISTDLTGYSHEALLKMHPDQFDELLPQEQLQERISEVMKKGSSIFETQIVQENGNQVPVEIRAREIDYYGQPAIIVTIRDIVERKEVQAALRLQEKAIASSRSGIIITDLNGVITYANQAYLDLVGHTDFSTVIGKRAMEDLGGEGLSPEALAAFLQRGYFNVEYTHALPDGTPIDLHVQATIISDEEGKPSHLMATITDITELKAAEAQFRHLFESVPVGIFRTKPGVGEILGANPALVKILGFPDEESLRKRKASSFYINPDDRRKWEERIAKEDVIRGFESEFERLDGRKIWVRLSSRAIRDHMGNVEFYEGTIEDITERKHAQQALAASEERYRLFFENISDVILQIDPQLRLVDVSPSIEKHLGYHPDDLKGRFYPELNILAPEYLETALKNSKKLFSGEMIGPRVYSFIRADGSRIWGEISSTPITRNGEVVALFSLVRNINDQKLAEIELRNTNRDLELYASLLRHDLGNDLQVIFSTAEVTQILAPEASEMHELTETTRAAAERMVRLLDLFGRPDKEAEKEIFSLIERVATQATKTHKRLNIQVEAPDEIKGIRVAGGRLLPMVFDNLFRNAAQHAGEQTTVKVTIAQEDSRVRVDIIDNGPGIPKKLQSKLFQRGASTTGSGLGLNLSKRILEAYGGTIELLPAQTGQGAAFRIILPLEKS